LFRVRIFPDEPTRFVSSLFYIRNLHGGTHDVRVRNAKVRLHHLSSLTFPAMYFSRENGKNVGKSISLVEYDFNIEEKNVRRIF
jgi:hypothetical protein